MSISWKTAVPLIALLAASVPAFAQVGTVDGDVKGPDGKPIEGAVIALDRKDITQHFEVKSDKKGHYVRSGIPAASYSITLTVDGTVRDKINSAQINPGSNQPIDFNLKPAGAPGAPAAAPDPKTMSKEDQEKLKAREAQLAKNKALNDAFGAGKAALDAKNWQEAVDNLKKASELDAKQMAVWGALADAYTGFAKSSPATRDENYANAVECYKKMIELKPEEAGTYNNYGLVLASMKKMDDARANIEKAAKLDPPNSGKYYYNLGALLLNSGQNDAAAEQFKRAIDGDANYADAQFQYGAALFGKASTDAAGKLVVPPGTVEALQKYLSLKADGQFAQSAKDMITALGTSISTSYKDPNAPAPKTTKGKGK